MLLRILEVLFRLRSRLMNSDSRILKATTTFSKKTLKEFKKAQRKAHSSMVDPEVHLFWEDDLEHLYQSCPFTTNFSENEPKKEPKCVPESELVGVVAKNTLTKFLEAL